MTLLRIMPDPADNEDEFRMMTEPNWWPNWPYQTIKNRKLIEADGIPKCALLVDFGTPGESYDIHFLDANLWGDISKEQLAASKATPPIDAEKMIQEGWVID